MNAACSSTVILRISEFTALLILTANLCSPVARTSYYYDYAEEEDSNLGEWWRNGSENETEGVIELCSGLIDTNSSMHINSSNSTKGDHFCDLQFPNNIAHLF